MPMPDGTTIKFPANVLTLIRRDAEKKETTISDVIRRIVKKHYRKHLYISQPLSREARHG